MGIIVGSAAAGINTGKSTSTINLKAGTQSEFASTIDDAIGIDREYRYSPVMATWPPAQFIRMAAIASVPC